MPQRSKRDGLVKSVSSVPQTGRSRFVHIDDHLARILSSLAHLLLRHGYGHGRLARLTKTAFVDAARSIGPKLNSKANIARIAALTGLTRVEVSRILKADRTLAISDNHLNRASRVAAGWRTDKRYLDRRGSPRRLALSGSGLGFADLVKRYSGDIPARAMLGLVTRSDSGMISLIRDIPVLPSSAVATVGAIAPWVNFVACTDGASSKEVASQTQQMKIYFNSLSEVIAAARELGVRQRSFVAGIQQLGTRTRLTGGYEVTVSVAVATTRPSRASRNRIRRTFS
jgi:hypothetical protein